VQAANAEALTVSESVCPYNVAGKHENRGCDCEDSDKPGRREAHPGGMVAAYAAVSILSGCFEVV
jgi:hypothetical protein